MLIQYNSAMVSHNKKNNAIGSDSIELYSLVENVLAMGDVWFSLLLFKIDSWSLCKDTMYKC